MIRYFLSALAIGWLLPSTFAVTVTLHPVADACLWEHEPGNNLGGSDSVASGRTANISPPSARARSLFQFDLSSIPTNAVVNSAALTLRVTRVPSGSVAATNDLRRVLQSWGEGKGSGTVGTAAKVNEVTWKARFAPSQLWSVAGGAVGTDFSSSMSASKLLSTVSSFTFASTPALVADVQNWVQNPAINFGWVLISQKEATERSAKRIGTRESGTPPALLIDYTLPTSSVPPSITTQPRSITVPLGSNAVFAVAAQGTSPLAYQWLKNGANVSGATDSTLTFAAAQLSDAANYSVIVTNTAGSVTSAIARLVVAQDLKINRADAAGGIFKLSFTALFGNTYAVEFKDSLSTNAWTTLTNIDARQQTFDTVVSNRITSSARFYRIEATPSP